MDDISECMPTVLNHRKFPNTYIPVPLYCNLWLLTFHSYPLGSVVLIILNLNFYVATADLLNEDLVLSDRDVFWLSPPAGNLTSTSVQLNGVTLELVQNTELPNFEPDEQQPGVRLLLPSISFGFIVFKNAKLNACL